MRITRPRYRSTSRTRMAIRRRSPRTRCHSAGSPPQARVLTTEGAACPLAQHATTAGMPKRRCRSRGVDSTCHRRVVGFCLCLSRRQRAWPAHACPHCQAHRPLARGSVGAIVIHPAAQPESIPPPALLSQVLGRVGFMLHRPATAAPRTRDRRSGLRRVRRCCRYRHREQCPR